ncbi:ASCH domain-containing protein [Serratia sp. Lou2A]|uniref:ASCH domain-containing protein n=1 Tax=Serratia montpellierensis TaxID=2598730 RepID=A0ABS8J7L8_9GAMM|nr:MULTISPECIES: ASCH domain-containing protein [Serratia]EIY4262269.1 ASCH domain-containing protein [Serratia marcescens]MCC7586232.1 ASCH domain-containing protein [Serratia sp. Lou2A]MCC7659939.1 ASCH domain-containing protein [Serratia sp. Pon4B]MDP8743877.1 ASCH domain-containing protein [Serratia marcescens]MTD07238.1 ASCH domain-containing protein [Serratia sp. YC16]
MKVLLSIKPEYAEKILDGSKKFEFRKGIFKNEKITTVVIYATMPIGKIVGEFQVDSVLTGSPDAVWAETKKFAGITKEFFDMYYEGREKAFAIKIGSVDKFDAPLPLSALGNNITPPQSYRYLLA